MEPRSGRIVNSLNDGDDSPLTEGRAETIFAERKRKLAEAQERRKEQHAAQRLAGQNDPVTMESIDIPAARRETAPAG
ncbi:MAG: hypothetical protein H7839_09110 [Magnetococcus sp. YQC-5]